MRNAECGVLDTQWVQWGYLIHFDRGSANGRLPDFESGDGGSIPPPRAQFCREPNEQASVFFETVTKHYPGVASARTGVRPQALALRGVQL